MNAKKISILFPIVLLFTSALVPALSLFVAAPGAAGFQFVPLVQVSPDDNSSQAAGPKACTTPAPVRTSTFFHCYTPNDITKAYGVDALHNAGVDGSGQTIVIVDAYGSPTALHDLQFFSTTFGLPAPDLTIVNPTGTPTFNNAMHGVQLGWAEETSLDLQWAHTIAPGAKLVLIEANPAETEGVQGFPSIFKGEEFAVTHYPGSVMSQSFAVTEQSFKSAADVQVAKFDQVYQLAVANHVTVLGSSGDSGTVNVVGGQGGSTSKPLPFPTVNWPSSDPLVTSAGGTWLQFGWTWNPSSPTDLSFKSTPGSRTEVVWNEPFLPAATGGGRSVLFSTPSFQSGIASSVLQGARGIPDLSWNAAVDGGVLVYTSFPGVRVGWHIIGGTSASSPQLAGLVALVNQERHALGKQSIGYLNPVLYTLPAGDFNDIVSHTFNAVTVGDNALFGFSVPGMPTTPGWDLTTGFGSPVAGTFVSDLAAKP
ncbi:MAG TPA: S53 family peptidase [Nitrososphaerales archaeon]|nr:S53 family peptidase [Nitrososphaerales archaeon]